MTQAGRRRALSNAVVFLCGAAVVVALVPLVLIFFYVIKQGFSSLNLDFFTKMPKPVGETGGGMANAIVGTLILIGIASAVAIPVGLIAGIYLSEYGSKPFASLVRFTADVLNGIPSIVIGIFAYGLVVMPVKRFSAVAGGARARVHDDPDHHADDGGAPESRALDPARRSAGARRDARPGRLLRHGPRRAARDHDRHPRVARAHLGRDGAAPLHGVQQPFLLDARSISRSPL